MGGSILQLTILGHNQSRTWGLRARHAEHDQHPAPCIRMGFVLYFQSTIPCIALTALPCSAVFACTHGACAGMVDQHTFTEVIG